MDPTGYGSSNPADLGISDGPAFLDFTVYDDTGNNASDSRELEVDTTPPVPAISIPEEGQVFPTGGGTILVEASLDVPDTISDPSTAAFVVMKTVEGMEVPGTNHTMGWLPLDGVWRRGFYYSELLPAGLYYVEVYIIDWAGNTGGDRVAIFLVD